MVARGWGRWRRLGFTVLVPQDERILEMDGGCTAMLMYLMPLNCTLNG